MTTGEEKRSKRDYESTNLLNQDLLSSDGDGSTNEKDLKRQRTKEDSDHPRAGSYSTRSQIDALASLEGEMVAACVTKEWFVLKVLHFDKDTKEFQVVEVEPDDDDDHNPTFTKYKLPMSYVIPFPKKQNDPSSVPEFPAGTSVLAVYPGTTALYEATVITTPEKNDSDDYVLEFDNDEEDGDVPQMMVPFHKVIALPEEHQF